MKLHTPQLLRFRCFHTDGCPRSDRFNHLVVWHKAKHNLLLSQFGICLHQVGGTVYAYLQQYKYKQNISIYYSGQITRNITCTNKLDGKIGDQIKKKPSSYIVLGSCSWIHVHILLLINVPGPKCKDNINPEKNIQGNIDPLETFALLEYGFAPRY